MAFFNLTRESRQHKANQLERLAWLTLRIAFALLFFSGFTITASVMLLVALLTALSGKKGREKIRNLGESPWSWIKDKNYRWAVLLPLAFELTCLILFFCGVFVPGVTSFYMLTLPITSLVFNVGLAAVGLGLIIGFASWLLRPSTPKASSVAPVCGPPGGNYRHQGPRPACALALVPAPSRTIVDGFIVRRQSNSGRGVAYDQSAQRCAGVRSGQASSRPVTRLPGGGNVHGFSS